jgi:hypothetical protein
LHYELSEDQAALLLALLLNEQHRQTRILETVSDGKSLTMANSRLSLCGDCSISLQQPVKAETAKDEADADPEVRLAKKKRS